VQNETGLIIGLCGISL